MNAKKIKVKFTGTNSSDFNRTLKQRLDAYFKELPNGYLADGRMWFKIVFWLTLWVATWFLIIFSNLPGYALAILGVAHMFTHLFIAFNISHDANHNAIHKNNLVNSLLSLTFDLNGVNSYLWRYSHNTAHHSYVNIEGADTSSQGMGIIRFTSNAPWKPIFRYQHFYAPLLYSIATLNYVFTKDFLIFWHLKNNQSGMKPPVREWVKLIVTKAFYYSYIFVIPALVLPYSFWQILGVFVFSHAFLGLTLALIFQTGHLTEETNFPPLNEDGNVEKNWAIHIVETTGDYARQNKLVSWMAGGINIHVIHHLYPKICHTHYYNVAEIVQRTAEEHGLQYRNIDSFSGAIISHFKLLKQLGQKPVAAAA